MSIGLRNAWTGLQSAGPRAARSRGGWAISLLTDGPTCNKLLTRIHWS